MSSSRRNNMRVPTKAKARKSTIRSETYTFTVFFEQGEDSLIVASVPALSGCATQGKNHEEATTNVKDAITAYLESLRKDGEPIPRPPAEEVIGRVQVRLRVPA